MFGLIIYMSTVLYLHLCLLTFPFFSSSPSCIFRLFVCLSLVYHIRHTGLGPKTSFLDRFLVFFSALPRRQNHIICYLLLCLLTFHLFSSSLSCIFRLIVCLSVVYHIRHTGLGPKTSFLDRFFVFFSALPRRWNHIICIQDTTACFYVSLLTGSQATRHST